MENINNQDNVVNTGNKVKQSIVAGPFKFIVTERIPFWTLETNNGPVVLSSLTLPMLESMLVYPEVVSDTSLYIAITAILNRMKSNFNKPYQLYYPSSMLQMSKQYQSTQPPVQFRQQPPSFPMMERQPMSSWVDPVQNDTKPMAPIAQNTENNVKSNKDKLRASLLNKIVERSLHIKEGTEIDLGHCVITYRSDIIAGCKWQLKAGVNIVMTCDDISYIIDYMIDNCSWQ
jgi:hypothetical protein